MSVAPPGGQDPSNTVKLTSPAGSARMAARRLDKFGFRLGTKRARPALLYERGATQAEITAAIGYPHYNMLKDAKRRGYRVVHFGKRFWLVHASDIANVKAEIDSVQRQPKLTQTQKEALIQVRIGQVQFRRDQIHSWGACAVTGCAVQAVLEACHIKPWVKSSHSERQDADNGLCLTANLHRLFDAGLITFDDQGKMLVSKRMSKKDRLTLRLEGRLSRTPTRQQHVYLKFHRENVFR